MSGRVLDELRKPPIGRLFDSFGQCAADLDALKQLHFHLSKRFQPANAGDFDKIWTLGRFHHRC